MVVQPSAFSDELKPFRELWNKALQAFQQQPPKTEEGLKYFNEFLARVDASPQARTNSRIELMIGKMGCALALPKYRERGKINLIRARASLKDNSPTARAEIERLLSACGSDGVELPREIAADPVMASGAGDEPGVSGSLKAGNPYSAKPVASVVVSPKDPSEMEQEMEKRLAQTSNPATALAAARIRFAPRAAGIVTPHFVVVTDGGGTKLAAGVATCLDRYRVDLNQEFDMIFPPYRVTVYNTQLDGLVPRYAGQLHWLKLPPGTIAYSVYDDLSLVGAGSPQVCGSLAHELTHLMIRGNFGDAPPWLEEGLASAVALATPEYNHLSFHPGWRDHVLQSNLSPRPSVSDLLNFTWSDFTAADYDAGLKKTATIQAMAAIFIRYLAAKDKLRAVYFGVRRQDLATDLDHYRSPQQIVEEQLGKNVAEVDRDFDAWFREQPRR
jgi:hypothetical protein